MKRRLILVAATVAFLAAGSAHAAQILFNGGFEYGLAGWDHSANVVASSGQSGVTPYAGSGMAVMAPYGLFDASLSQDFSTVGYQGPGTLSFAYSLQAFDTTYCYDWGRDSLRASAYGYAGGEFLFEQLLDVSLNDPRGGGPTTQAWTVLAVPFASVPQGEFTIRFRVENTPPGWGDSGQLFTAFIDEVSVTAQPVPEPGSMVLLGSGLVALAGFSRRLSLRR